VSFFNRLFSRLAGAISLGRRTSEARSLLLSKSKYLVGLQCPKALWIHYNDKGLLPEVDAATAALFNQGHDIGLLAQKLFPEGIRIGYSGSFDEAIQSTRNALSKRRPLFEPAFSYKRCFSRADVLDPVEENRWDIIEVKSSTDVKPVYFQDVAFQRYVYEGAGLSIRNCYVLHVNNSYVRFGAIDPAAFFSKIDITNEIGALIPDVEAKVANMLQVFDLPKCPDIKISPHCDDPYECVLKPICWNFLPEPNVFYLRNGRQKRWDLFARGVLRLEEIPADFALSDPQCRQVAAHRSGFPHIDREAIRRFIDRLIYPLYFLDFETIFPAIPLFDRSKPYGQIPFQFSLHMKKTPAAEPQHYGFLADGHGDPRPTFLTELKRLLGETGSILAYNTKFEIARLTECAGLLPEYQSWCDKTLPRFIDLLDVFDSLDYYHPAQSGSASLKAVLPALTGKSYSGLDIQDGEAAGREFMRITFGEIGLDERQKVRQQLDAYCRQDTQALIDILFALQQPGVSQPL
jgi:hypothetical protein